MELIHDNGEIKLGNTVLPGVLESIEVEDDTKIDEVEIKGKTKKASQATEYNATRVRINLNLLSDLKSSAKDKLKIIVRLFRPSKAHENPLVYRMVADQVQAHHVNEVVFTTVRSRATNMNDMIYAALEFMEHQPITVGVSKVSSAGGYSTHIVIKGETVSSIARKYGVSVQALVTANKIVDARSLKVGQKLVIPSPSKTKKKQAKTPTVKSPKVIDSRSWTTADIGKSTVVKDDAKPPKMSR